MLPTLENKEVKGKVVQQDGSKPLQGAIIVVKGTTMGVTTDDKGSFTLKNVPDDGELVVTYVGFKSKVVKPDFTTSMTIKMVKDTVNLKSVGVPPSSTTTSSASSQVVKAGRAPILRHHQHQQNMDCHSTSPPPPPPPPPQLE